MKGNFFGLGKPGASSGGEVTGDVTVVNEHENPVPTDETYYSDFTVEKFTVPYSAEGVGVPLSLTPTACKGLIIQSSTNNTVGSIIFLGSSAGDCFIELFPGGVKSYSITDPSQVYCYTNDSEEVATLIVEMYDPEV